MQRDMTPSILKSLAKGVGPTAVIERMDVSAFLVYQNHTKYGILTEAAEEGAVRNLPAPRPETLRRRQADPGSEP